MTYNKITKSVIPTKINRGYTEMKKHFYKDFVLVRNGYPNSPWNIYKPNRYGFEEWVDLGITLNSCKRAIDDGCYD